MTRYYVPLPAAQAPRNSMLNFAPLQNAITGIKDRNRQAELDEQNAMLRTQASARADASLGLQQERLGMAKKEFAQGQRDRTMKKIAGVVQMVEGPEQWQRLLQSRPEIANSLAENGIDPGDWQAGRNAIIAEAQGYQEPTQPEWKKIGQDAYGNDQFGWVNPQTMDVQGRGGGQVLPGLALAQGGAPNIPPGVDPKTYMQQRAKEQAKLDVKQPEVQRAALNKTQELVQQGDIVLAEIDKALNQSKDQSWMPLTAPTGATGAVRAQIPGSLAYDLARTLDTIRANVGFDKLQAMREASPTGGALGQVSERENILLQAVLGSLDQFQSKEQLQENLTRIREIIAARKQRYQQAYDQDFGGQGEPQSGVIFLGYE